MIQIDMEMPEKCGLCPLFHAEHPMYCQGVKADRKKKIVAPYRDPRPEWCPIPEIQPDPDTVSRKAVLDAVCEELDSIDHVPQWVFDRLTKKIENLPSAQPELCEGAVSRRRLLSDLKELIAAWEKYPVMAEQIKGVEAAIGYVESIPSAQEKRTEERTETHTCDCISRQAAIDALDKRFDSIPMEQTTEILLLRKDLRNLPSAQPQRMSGKWTYGEDEYGIDGYHCDKCGFFVPWDYTHKFIDFIKDYHFCPYCGADMRGEQNEH